MWKQDNIKRVETLSKGKVLVREAKTHLELYLSKLQQEYQQQKETRTIKLLLNSAGKFWMNQNTESAFVFTAKIYLLGFQIPQILQESLKQRRVTLSRRGSDLGIFEETEHPQVYGTWLSQVLKELENLIAKLNYLGKIMVTCSYVRNSCTMEKKVNC